MPEAKLSYQDGDDEVAIPARWEICPACQGRKQVPLQGIAFTESDIEEAGDNFRQDYFGGFYDQPCTECKGEGLVAVPDEDRATPEQLAGYLAVERARYEYDAERRAEIAFGC